MSVKRSNTKYSSLF